MSTQKIVVLTIDVGNTTTKMAVFSDNLCLHSKRINELNVALLKRWIRQYDVKAISYSASGNDVEEIIEYIENFDNHIFLSSLSPMPIEIAYKTPETLGKDRIAAVLGAYALFPKQHIVVIDLGTCITYEVLSSDGIYIGGNIAPGMQMRLQSMHDYTARLPLVEFELVTNWIGQSTNDAIKNGAILGTQMEIESFIGRVKKFLGSDPQKLDDVQLILTGGDGAFMYNALEENLQTKIHLEPQLIHIGLNALMQYNL
jgi:type III pantothenate kinase